MKIYYEIINDCIENLSDEKFSEENQIIEGESFDEIYKKINNIGKLSQESEDNLSSFFENEIEEMYEDSLTTFDIKHWVSNRSFGELIDMYNTEEILKPKMQRNFVWDALKCSRLIESIILGLPIPPLFLLEAEKNSYEIIDGFQRLTTLYNFVNGYPWNHVFGNEIDKSSRPSKLSSKVSKEIAGLTFEKLEPKHQRTIKRSTLPLIEFKQLSPDDNFKSKYLIFERINTGSEKLTPMQIRKSLAYGTFIESVYEFTFENERFNSLFTSGNIKKDLNVEAMIRIIMMLDYIDGKFTIDNSGMKNNLNEYCYQFRNKKIDNKFMDIFNESLEKVVDAFDGNYKDMFRRVYKEDDQLVPTGNLNISILESFMATLIDKVIKGYTFYTIPTDVMEKYRSIIYKSSEGVNYNPFSISTGSKQTIDSRLETMKELWENL